MPRDHPLAKRKAVGLQELQAYPLISFSRDRPIGALVEAAYVRAALRRSIAIEVTQSWTACALVQAGSGIAVVDGFALLGGMFSDLVARPLQPRVRIAGRLLIPRHRPMSRLAVAFAGEFEAVVAEHVRRGELSRAASTNLRFGEIESRPASRRARARAR
jgi:DNA-binding transcriptional LysR family regulator